MLPICKTYAQTFSTASAAKSMVDNQFPVEKRAGATKCDGNAWLQQGSRSPYVVFGEDTKVIEKKDALTPQELQDLKTPEGIVELNEAGIELAVERRIALFFHQSILCHNMSQFEFIARGADDQIGSSPAVKFSDTDKKTITHKREAAHSSTLPTLIAKKKGTTHEFVYLKGGSSHAQHNATIGMHESVNGADELIDGKRDKLRSEAVEIINLVANGLNPEAATREFVERFYKEVRETQESLNADDPRRAVLARYKREIELTRAVINDKGFFDHLMGVQIVNDQREKDLRRVVYQKRYDIIRLQEVVESRMGKRFENFIATMAKTDKAFFEHVLIKEFSGTPFRQQVEKLLNKSTVVFEKDYKIEGLNDADLKKKEKAHKTFRTRVENIRLKHADALKKLKAAMLPDIRELRAAELTYRSGLFADLRKDVNKWTQGKFCTEYRKQVGWSISKSWVSRLENLSHGDSKAQYKTPINQRRKLITLADAKNYAKAFGVDAGLFLPGMFTSTYE
jgi:hypothetical protein